MTAAITAQRAEDFVQSIGVNTHIGYTGTIYGNVANAQQEMTYLGVYHARDQQPFANNQAAYQALANQGVKFDLYVGGPGNDFDKDLPSLLPYIDIFAKSNPGAIFSLEGPNELNGGNPVYYNSVSSASSGTVSDQVMQAIKSAVLADPTLSKLPVLNASLGGSSNYLTYTTQEGNMSGYVDGANSHDYFSGGEQPLNGLTYAAQLARQSVPGKPLTFTESGYFTAYQDSSGWGGVDQATQAKNTLNLLADAWKLGAQQTYLYELMEGAANPSTTDIENTFGLFTSDGTPKLVATAIHNLTSILSDTATNAQNFTAGSLSHTISGLPSTGSSILLEKANGAFDLMVWNEAPDWNPTTQSEISVSPVNTTIALGQTYGTVKIFDPMKGSAAIQTLTNVGNVTIGLTDHPLIVEVEPAGATPTPPPTPTPVASPDNAVVKTVGPAIVDGHGNSWTITVGGQVAVNGTVDGTTSSVVELAYEKGLVWQENTANLWWSKTLPTDAWGPAAGTSVSPVPVTPTPPAPPVASSDNTVVKTAGPAIVDARGNSWTITAGGQVAVNGTVDGTTSSVVELAYEKGLIWQENTASLWWSKTLPTDAWGPVAGTSVSPVPVTLPPVPVASPDDTVVKTVGPAIVDTHGNSWTITAGGQVAVNGTVDGTTSSVVELAYEKGIVWQENTANLWWSKTLPTDAWGPAAGTSVSPVPVTPTRTITVTPKTGTAQTINGNTAGTVTASTDTFVLNGNGVANVTTGSAGQTLSFVGMTNITLTAGSGSVVVKSTGGTNTFTVGKGSIEIAGGTGADAYVKHAGTGSLTIDDFSAAKGDTLVFDKSLQPTMKATSDGNNGTAIGFQGLAPSVDLKGVTALPTSAIHWV